MDTEWKDHTVKRARQETVALSSWHSVLCIWVRRTPSPGVDEVLDGLGEHEESGGGRGQNDLQAQEAVHLPQEVWSVKTAVGTQRYNNLHVFLNQMFTENALHLPNSSSRYKYIVVCVVCGVWYSFYVGRSLRDKNKPQTGIETLTTLNISWCNSLLSSNQCSSIQLTRSSLASICGCWRHNNNTVVVMFSIYHAVFIYVLKIGFHWRYPVHHPFTSVYSYSLIWVHCSVI